MSVITMDPYYDVEFFNSTREALRNNGVNHTVKVHVKPPFDWYIDSDGDPAFVNYDRLPSSERRWVINTVNGLTPRDDYLLQRRAADVGSRALVKFTENEPLRAARRSSFAVFFTVKNLEDAIGISKEYPGTLYYLGRHYNNKYRVFLAVHGAIMGIIDPGTVLLEKTTNEPGMFEAELNHRVFRDSDSLVKFTETPFLKNGKYHRVNIQGEHSGRFTL